MSCIIHRIHSFRCKLLSSSLKLLRLKPFPRFVLLSIAPEVQLMWLWVVHARYTHTPMHPHTPTHTLSPSLPAPWVCPIRGRSAPAAVCTAATYSVTAGWSVTLSSDFLYVSLPPKGQWLTPSLRQMTHQCHHSSATKESLASASPSLLPLRLSQTPGLYLPYPPYWHLVCVCVCEQGLLRNCITNLPHMTHLTYTYTNIYDTNFPNHTHVPE